MISTTFTETQIDNAIVGNYKNYFVVKDDNGDLFVTEKIPDNLISYGETVPMEDLISIDNLSADEQEQIKNRFSDCEV